MSEFVAALPMYDWPERRAEVDAQWAAIRDALRASGIDAPERLARRNADLPPVPGGIRNRDGDVIAPDPATLPPEEFDLPTLWRHPRLLFAQTCWGPMQATGLANMVTVLGQPDYSDVEGGRGPRYSSAIVIRRGGGEDVAAPEHGGALLPLERIRQGRLAFNDPHSWSGLLGLNRDLNLAGERALKPAEHLQTGGHRHSLRAVAEGRADFAAIDCRSWALAKIHEPAAGELEVAGWTSRQMGLPYIGAPGSDALNQAVRTALGR